MIELTTLSWSTFFIVASVLVGIWFLTVKTRLGRLVVERETPWNVEQWVRFLIVILVTVFILVNPVFHLLTFVVVAVLYYILVAQNFLSKNLMELGKKRDQSSFLNLNYDRLKIECMPAEEKSLLEHKRALEKCLFSFPLITGDEPVVRYENETFFVDLNISSEKYAASLFSYIGRAGFQVLKIDTK